MKLTRKQWITGLILAGLLTQATSTLALTAVAVDLEATRAVENFITVESAATGVTNLGIAAQSDVKFGDITINSNDGAGFQIKLSSEKNGEMVLLDKDSDFVSGPGVSQKIAYKVKVVDAGGTLGIGLTAATNLNTAIDLTTTATNFDFNGPASSSSSAYKLDLKFITAVSDGIMGGEYKDVVTVEIAEFL